MPQKQEESLFEEDEINLEEDDWDFSHMEYLWYSVLKRMMIFTKLRLKHFFNKWKHIRK